MRAPFDHLVFTTREPDVAHDYMRRLYVDYAVRLTGDTADFRFRSDLVRVDDVTLNHVSHSTGATVETDGVETPTIWAPHTPAELTVGTRVLRIDDDGAVSLQEHVPYRVSWDTLEADVTALDPRLLREEAEASGGLGPRFSFDFDHALSRDAVAHWNQVLAFVRRAALSVVASAEPDRPLLAHELARLVTSAALTCFPNRTLAESSTPARAGPSSLRRALAHIDGHLDQPLTLAGISGAARVSPRALQETFVRHLGTTPMRYVRRARLAAIHRDLQAAMPGDGVATIASRWGFPHAGRLAEAYRRTFGESPSDTLRRSA